jgi:hypothetical protein
MNFKKKDNRVCMNFSDKFLLMGGADFLDSFFNFFILIRKLILKEKVKYQLYDINQTEMTIY